MRYIFGPWSTGLALCARLWAVAPAVAAQEPPPDTLTLAAALVSAANNNPLIRAAELRVREASGNLTQAAVLLAENPEIAATRGRRTPLTGSTAYDIEFEVGLEQRLEIAGQRGKRMDAARSGVEAARSDAEDVRRVVSLTVAATYFEALAANQRVALAERNERLTADLLGLATRRLDSGIGTPLEVNAAVVRHAEARRSTLEALSRRDAALVRLQALLGLDGAPPRLAGALPELALPLDVDAVVSLAQAVRPDLAGAARRAEAAAARSRLASAEAWPDVALAASLAREEGDDVFRAGVRIPLALFDRRQGARASARAEADRAAAEREAVRLEVVADARAAGLAYERAAAALRLYDDEVLQAQRESADLVQLAAESGEVSILDVLVVQRELLDGLLGHLEARLEVARAQARVLAAVDRPQTTPLTEIGR
ncbi:MAG: hypothetical protein AMXMBFR53_15480 [Gemmatimonadota bacterium]